MRSALGLIMQGAPVADDEHHAWSEAQPIWEVMFSFAGSLREEVRKVAEYFVHKQMPAHSIFFDDWSIPRCAHLTNSCKVGIACSKLIVFLISSEFLKPERKLSTFLEWVDGIEGKDAKSVLVVLYQKSTEHVSVLLQLQKKLQQRDTSVFVAAEKVAWTETKPEEKNHNQLPARIFELVLKRTEHLPPFPSGLDSWPRWGFPEASPPATVIWHGVGGGVIDQLRVFSQQYGNYLPCALPHPGAGPTPHAYSSVVHVFMVSCDEQRLTDLKNALPYWALSSTNPPFLIYIEKPFDVAKRWKHLFQAEFWCGDYLGYHWKYQDNDTIRCFSKLTGTSPVMNLPSEKAIRPMDSSYTNSQWAMK